MARALGGATGSTAVSALLEVADLSRSFGGVRAVDGLSLSVEPATIHGIIGPNGSGKTTFLGLLSGTYRPHAGSIRLQGRAIEGLPAHRTVAAGVARTFQTTRLFARWTLRANLEVAATTRRAAADASPLLAPSLLAPSLLAPSLLAPSLLALVGLAARGDAPCSALSNAEQRLAMIAVALATGPLLLLLDEPAVGMAPSEAASLGRVIRRIRDELGVGVLIVEHNMHLMMGLADRILVMNAGRKLVEGTPEAVRRDPDVIACYLGR